MTDDYTKRRDAAAYAWTGYMQADCFQEGADWGRADARAENAKFAYEAGRIAGEHLQTIERLERERFDAKSALLLACEDVKRLTAENAELRKTQEPYFSGRVLVPKLRLELSRSTEQKFQLAETIEKLRAERDDMKAHIDQCERNLIDTQRERDNLRAERDAYAKAKAENDERFQLEAGELRARLEKAETRLTTALADAHGYTKERDKAMEERDSLKFDADAKQAYSDLYNEANAMAERLAGAAYCYAEAMAIALRDGLFPEKAKTLAAISLITPYAREALAEYEKSKEGK